MIVLAGDIGGTNARLALVDVGATTARIVDERVYATQQAPSLESIVRRFLGETGGRVERACVGVAGPVVGDEARLSNVAWAVRAGGLAAELGLEQVSLINDFRAVGEGLLFLAPDDLLPLQQGERDPRGPIALIGAGTGLGQGFLLWEGARYRVHPSEGGHASFAPQTGEQRELQQFMADEWGHVSWERVLSGPGLVNVYRYLSWRDPGAQREEVRKEMQRKDPAAVISRRALEQSDALCVRALHIFSTVLGAQAGNFALTVLASGGVYLAGGIAPKIVDKLRDGSFTDAFRHKGRLSSLLERMPVHVIMNRNVGLLGAAAVAGAPTG
jgi:glucokinase